MAGGSHQFARGPATANRGVLNASWRVGPRLAAIHADASKSDSLLVGVQLKPSRSRGWPSAMSAEIGQVCAWLQDEFRGPDVNVLAVDVQGRQCDDEIRGIFVRQLNLDAVARRCAQRVAGFEVIGYLAVNDRWRFVNPVYLEPDGRCRGTLSHASGGRDAGGVYPETRRIGDH
jgi:hypothetical protein